MNFQNFISIIVFCQHIIPEKKGACFKPGIEERKVFFKKVFLLRKSTQTHERDTHKHLHKCQGSNRKLRIILFLPTIYIRFQYSTGLASTLRYQWDLNWVPLATQRDILTQNAPKPVAKRLPENKKILWGLNLNLFLGGWGEEAAVSTFS